MLHQEGAKMRIIAGLTGAACLLALSETAFAESVKDMAAPPSLETRLAIEALTPKDSSGNQEFRSTGKSFKELSLRPSKETPSTTNPKGEDRIPFVAQDSIILQFQPNVTASQIGDYIKSHDFQVVKTFPSIGAVQIRTDLSRFFRPETSDGNANDAIVKGLVAASDDFKKDP